MTSTMFRRRQHDYFMFRMISAIASDKGLPGESTPLSNRAFYGILAAVTACFVLYGLLFGPLARP